MLVIEWLLLTIHIVVEFQRIAPMKEWYNKVPMQAYKQRPSDLLRTLFISRL